MSVLIKGVDMPKVCADCPCFYDNICCNALPYGEGTFCDYKRFDEYDGRLPNCPLVEVSEDAVSPCEVCPLVKEMNENVDELVGELYGEDGSLKPRYCDRNICASNEVNGIGCEECEIAKYHNLEDDDSPCLDCGEEEDE